MPTTLNRHDWQDCSTGVLPRDLIRSPIGVVAQVGYLIGRALLGALASSVLDGLVANKSVSFVLAAEHLPNERMYWSFELRFRSGVGDDARRLLLPLPRGPVETVRFIHPGGIEVVELFHSAIAQAGMALVTLGTLSVDEVCVTKPDAIFGPAAFEIRMTFQTTSGHADSL